jgi:hypothetical protein
VPCIWKKSENLSIEIVGGKLYIFTNENIIIIIYTGMKIMEKKARKSEKEEL